MRTLKAAGGFIAPGLAFALTATYLPWMPDPNVARWAIVFVAALLSCAVLFRAQFDRIDAAALIFATWCAFSIFWSPDRLASIDAAEKLGAVVLIFLALRRIERSWIVPAAVAGVGLAALIGKTYAGTGNPEFLVQFALIAIPLLFPLTITGVVCVVGMVGAIVMAPSLIPLSVVAGVPFLLRQWWARLALASVLATLAVAVIAHSTEAQIGVGTRLDMFAGTFAAWLVHPVNGWGLGSFVYVFPSYQGTGALFGLMPMSVEATTYANAAHNDFLQLAMETGVIGLGLGAWLLVEVWRGATKPARFAIGITAILCLTGFPMQSPATVMLAVVAASHASPMGWRFAALPVAVAGALAMVMIVATIPASVIAQAHFSAATRYYAKDVVKMKASAVVALAHAAQAYALNPSDPRIRLAVFQTAALTYERFPDAASRDGVEAAWKVAQSASPSDTLSLLTRLQFLIAEKECFKNRECDRIAGELVRTASRKQEVRRLVEVYG